MMMMMRLMMRLVMMKMAMIMRTLAFTTYTNYTDNMTPEMIELKRIVKKERTNNMVW